LLENYRMLSEYYLNKVTEKIIGFCFEVAVNFGYDSVKIKRFIL